MCFSQQVANMYQESVNNRSYIRRLSFEQLFITSSPLKKVQNELGYYMADCVAEQYGTQTYILMKAGCEIQEVKRILQTRCGLSSTSRTITKSLVPYPVFKSLADSLQAVLQPDPMPKKIDESIIITIDSTPDQKPPMSLKLVRDSEEPCVKPQESQSSEETTEEFEMEESSEEDGYMDKEAFYPRAFFSIGTQTINVKSLFDALEGFEQIQGRRNLIKQREVKNVLFVGLPQRVSTQEEQTLQTQFHATIVYNRDAPMTAQRMQAEIAHFHSEFLFDPSDNKVSRQLKESQHWGILPLHTRLDMIFRTEASFDRVNEVFSQGLSHFSIRKVQNMYGVSTTEKRSRGYLVELARGLEVKDLCTWPISKRFLPFHRYQKLCVQNIEHSYAKGDYINLLSEAEMALFVQMQTRLSLGTQVYNPELNIIFIDFEFYLTTSRYLLPLEVGVARFQDGALVATYHTFLEPKRFILEALSTKQRALLERGHVQPYTWQTQELLCAVPEEIFQAELLSFCTASSEDLLASNAYQQGRISFSYPHSHSSLENGKQKKEFQTKQISFIVANGIQAEKLALMQEGQQLLAENLAEFEEITRALLRKPTFVVQKDALHGPKDKEIHRCRAHVLSEHHCALNDAVNLALLFDAELHAEQPK